MPAQDPFGPVSLGPDGPYADGFAITPHDANDFAKVTSAIYVSIAQTALTVVFATGTVLDLGAVPAGTLLRIRAKRINAAGTAPGTGLKGLI
jgi:hypothetical protein